MTTEHITSRPVTDPAVILAALADAPGMGIRPAARRHRVSPKSVRAWVDYRNRLAAAGITWPTQADVDDWREKQPARSKRRKHVAASRRRRILRQPLLALVPCTGTQRRLQALVALGWTTAALGQRLGCSKARVGHLIAGRYPTVATNTAAAVAALYDQLSMTPGTSRSAALRAQAKGWPPPLAWDDDDLDDPAAQPHLTAPGETTDDDLDDLAIAAALDGHRMLLNPAELDVVVPKLVAAGHTKSDIAERLALTSDAVLRVVDRVNARQRRAALPTAAAA